MVKCLLTNSTILGLRSHQTSAIARKTSSLVIMRTSFPLALPSSLPNTRFPAEPQRSRRTRNNSRCHPEQSEGSFFSSYSDFLAEQTPPLLQNCLPILRAHAAHRREFVLAPVGSARIDNDAGAHQIVRRSLFRRQGRIEIARRHIDHFRLPLGVPARCHRP